MRIICPSCTSPLSIQDEHAGRAVKCPQCGGVIPATNTASPPSPAPDADEPPPLPPTDRPPARPTSRREDDDDLPRRRSRRVDDDDDDDRPRPRRRVPSSPPQKSNTGIVLLVVFGVLLLICGGVGFGVYTFMKTVKEKVDESLERGRNPATPENYHAIGYTMTRLQVENELGAFMRSTATKATMDDLKAVFANDSTSMQKWTPKVQQGRVLVWKNTKSQDRLFIAFYPDANSDSRVQMKELAGKTSGNYISDAYLYEDDAVYAKQFGLGLPKDPASDVTAGLLLGEYSSDRAKADRKYKGREVVVTEGILDKWDGNTAVVYSRTIGKMTPFRIRVEFLPSENEKFPKFQPGVVMKFTGTCEGLTGTNVIVKKATFD